MADIAAIFHWPPDVMAVMELEELADWHEKAIDRIKALKGIKN